MFDQAVNYPTAVASYDDVGVDAAINWCIEQMDDGDTISVWTSLVSNLKNSSKLQSFVNRHSNVQHVTGRGGGVLQGPGPVLMAWPDMDDLGKLTRFGSSGITALCIITWNEDWLRPWVAAMRPTILGDASPWKNVPGPKLDPVLEEALKGMTLVLNHNNTISGGYGKDVVVSGLLALRGAGINMDSGAVQAWALAHGWTGDNPKRLAHYIDDINAGKRPKATYAQDADYVPRMRRRAAGESD